MKRAFLILGAQRSGTSVISHVLSQFGIDFGHPERFLQAGHNPIFFELKWVNDDNNQLTRCLGHQYIDFFFPIETDFHTPAMLQLESQIADRIVSEWADRTPIGLKDPRFSLTFPVWQRVLSQLGYQLQVIFAFRCPAGFLASNRKLFDQWPGWTEQRHLNFWLQFNLAALYFTRHHNPFWMDYDQLMANPEPEITALAQFFNLDPAAIAPATAVIQPAEYHHSASAETGVPLIDLYYQRLRSREVTAADYLQLREQFSSVEFASSHPPS